MMLNEMLTGAHLLFDADTLAVHAENNPWSDGSNTTLFASGIKHAIQQIERPNRWTCPCPEHTDLVRTRTAFPTLSCVVGDEGQC